MPFLTTPNTNHRLHYADTHPSGTLPSPQSQTIVFIHGLGSSQNYYYGILPFLQDNHRCITLDTYGSGRSPYTGDPVSIHSIATDVLGAMDALQVARAVVVGHSMGGLVVTELGATQPDRIAGVVAVGPTHPTEAMVGVMSKRADTAAECMSPSLSFLHLAKC
jgi:pimeloyl-ACP methyl ester carboxylesterase